MDMVAGLRTLSPLTKSGSRQKLTFDEPVTAPFRRPAADWQRFAGDGHGLDHPGTLRAGRLGRVRG